MKKHLAALRNLLFPSILSLAPTVLAAQGDVKAFVDTDGVLFVIGDSLDNRVIVGRTGIPGEFRVEGELTTTVNGQPSVVLLADSVSIFMRGGNDFARVDGNIPGDVAIEGGPGNDFLTLGDPAIEGSAILLGGSGDDLLSAGDTFVAEDLTFRAGAGNDTVMLDYASPGVDGEPAVVHVDDDRVPRRLAADFAAFLAGLYECDEAG